LSGGLNETSRNGANLQYASRCNYFTGGASAISEVSTADSPVNKSPRCRSLMDLEFPSNHFSCHRRAATSKPPNHARSFTKLTEQRLGMCSPSSMGQSSRGRVRKTEDGSYSITWHANHVNRKYLKQTLDSRFPGKYSVRVRSTKFRTTSAWRLLDFNINRYKQLLRDIYEVTVPQTAATEVRSRGSGKTQP
jgi:hypothetical protein